jgi:hypothetical protein
VAGESACEPLRTRAVGSVTFGDDGIVSELFRTSLIAKPSGFDSDRGDGSGDGEVGFMDDLCPSATGDPVSNSVSCPECAGKGNAVDAFLDLEASAVTPAFLLALALSSFRMQSSHSPRSISAISRCKISYLLSSSRINLIIWSL